ncbi:putative guanyl-specific ribonuclease [Streptantibioticus cattleyicolor NRRL 8057 = DSM 46488]|uniref:Putative guanyl-specific ribonuclease n=1 Tax=Streptantibioticus cattleyicolor (strain ATCC 35852 / DSM 46488 / JCM 4925 / NBRC 14057 / NRRL 8057) TaxID=1003195 RepID=F8JW79_STREN|nr:putative guanyl-specific ribonuclease [Streptantibioticus cattleyicolor NRRL 8057 = DSM 46488]MYS57977.1 ribonuclease [Streptomyces sp. SID5468]CCB73616.1 Guanyl-specific ribonuclease Sa3 [Streptantibioticus cattleyicolor NRRL 8057 = DSM 46488]
MLLAGAIALGPATVLAATAQAATPTTASSAALRPAVTVHPASVGSVCQSALPSQADDTLDLIAQGGPFPYAKDGEVFYNNEDVLPSEPTGYYHAYTVKTPGVSTRGARRIVTADDGTDYYTADHYSTFQVIDFSC